MAGVLLDHAGVDPAETHLGLTMRIEVDLIKRVTRKHLPYEVDLASVGGEVGFGIGGVHVELGVEVVVAAIRIINLLPGEPGAEPGPVRPRPCGERVRAGTDSTVRWRVI
jgi:hypothetical protein